MSRTPASSREELERVQLAKLRKLLTAVRPANAFYEAKLGQAEVVEIAGAFDVGLEELKNKMQQIVATTSGD